MYCVVYKFHPDKGMDQRFIEYWEELTELIRVQLGGLGSRLHRTDEGVYFAYAQWPDKAHWKKMRTVEGSARMTELSALMKAISDPSEVVFSGEIVSNLFSGEGG